MRSLWEGLEGLHGHKLRLRLLERMAASEAVLERFWSRVKVKGVDECWNHEITPGCVYGYGRITMFSTDRKFTISIGAHRVSFYLFFKYLPEHLFICHHCDNRACVNPKHLFVGDDHANKQDMISKNRQVMGERQHLHKLTEKEVLWARKKYAAGGIIFCAIAAKLGMSYPAMRAAIRGETWKHLPFAVKM